MREARCSCGQLRLAVEGDPVRNSVCHCLNCQRRTGSAFAWQVRFAAADVRIEGRSTEYVRTSDDGARRSFHFCPDCGDTVYYVFDEESVAVPVGAFAEPGFPPPTVSVWEERQHSWVGLPEGIEHHF